MSNYKKYANEILDDVECYKMVLNGTLRTFPNGFWTKPYSLESAASIVRFLFEVRFKVKVEDVPKFASNKVLIENKLAGMLKIVFNGSIVNAINNAYPNRFKPWEYKSITKGFWEEEENVIKAIKWLVEDKLKWDKEQVKIYYTQQVLIKNGFRTIANRYGVYNIINMAYPNQFKPWELSGCIKPNYWNEQTASEAVRWLIEEKLKWNEDQVKEYYSKEILTKYSLSALAIYYGVYGSLNIAYPEKYKPWELKTVYKWDEESSIKAFKWLIEDKLNWNEEQVKKYYNQDVLNKNGLSYLHCKYGVYGILNKAYPNKFKPWEIRASAPQNYWNDERIKEAVKWVVEKKLKLKTKDEVIKNFTADTLNNLGLHGIVGYGIRRSLKLTYPNQFNSID